MTMLSITPCDVKDYLDWLKIQITISSAAIGAITLNPAAVITHSLIVASVFFIISIVAMIVGFAGLVEHKNSTTPTVSYKASIPVIIGHTSFILAFAVLVSKFF